MTDKTVIRTATPKVNPIIDIFEIIDMNDRSLRSININLGGVANGYPRQDGFDITVASECNSLYCLPLF